MMFILVVGVGLLGFRCVCDCDDMREGSGEALKPTHLFHALRSKGRCIHQMNGDALIYPAIREQIDEDELMNEATEEHHLVHVLIGELKTLDANDEIFTAKFTVLGELVKHHVKEEEGEIFPKAQKADLDWEAQLALATSRSRIGMAWSSWGIPRRRDAQTARCRMLHRETRTLFQT